MSTNGTGTSAVIFRETAGAIRAAVETGGTWGAPATLAANGQTADIAVAPNGDILAVWAFRTTNTYIPNEAQAAFYSGGHWGPMLTISANVYGNVYSVGLPSIGFDGNSRATVIWEQLTGPANGVTALGAASGLAIVSTGPQVYVSTAVIP